MAFLVFEYVMLVSLGAWLCGCPGAGFSQFLQYDNGQNAENRMLVFYSPDSLERLANAQTFFIFMDGTFSIAPHPFKQLYIIRGVWGFLHGAARLGHCRHTGTQPGQISGWVCLWCWLSGLSWHFWFLSTWCLYHWERDCVAAQELDFHSRMLVFYSPESLERLANAQTFMDGTFSVAPHPFKQLYTIRVPFKDVTGTALGFLHGAAKLGHCRYIGTQPGQRSGWVCLWCWLRGLSWHFCNTTTARMQKTEC
jgi:hypothetical protein